MPEKFTWVFENFSSFQDKMYHDSPSFTAGGRDWRIYTYAKAVLDDGSYGDGLSVFLHYAPESPIPGKGKMKYRLTLVNANPQYNKVIGEQCLMDGKTICSFEDFFSLDQLRNLEGFLVDDKLTIVAELDFPPVNVAPLESVKMINSKEASVKGNSCSL